jgi:hypothetical protein
MATIAALSQADGSPRRAAATLCSWRCRQIPGRTLRPLRPSSVLSACGGNSQSGGTISDVINTGREATSIAVGEYLACCSSAILVPITFP